VEKVENAAIDATPIGAEPQEGNAQQRHTVVPLPETLQREQPRRSLWQRIALRARRNLAGGIGGEARALSRLDIIDARVAALQQTLGNGIEQLDQRISQVWELEDQLTQLIELQATVGEVRDRQTRIDTRLRGIERRLSIVLLLAVAGGIAGAVALALGA
jgi:hypothetical protein